MRTYENDVRHVVYMRPTAPTQRMFCWFQTVNASHHIVLDWPIHISCLSADIVREFDASRREKNGLKSSLDKKEGAYCSGEGREDPV